MKESFRQLPFVQTIYRRVKESRYKQKFETDGYGTFWGTYETFEHAIQAAPKTKPVGYNHTELANEYQQMLEQENWENSGRIIASYDYPILFWLQSIFAQGNKKIFDFGGNVGIHFYAYSKYLSYPDDLQWMVCDYPEIIKAGQKLAEKYSSSKLSFTADFNLVEENDIFLASGSVQYAENLLSKFYSNARPKHVLMNRLPLYNGKQFVTLQNGGSVFYPQCVFDRAEFIKMSINLGYELIDIWEDRNGSCIIPFHPEASVYSYSGLYFRLRD
jgi:putative methyltransferase (TIGR04325 family)